MTLHNNQWALELTHPGDHLEILSETPLSIPESTPFSLSLWIKESHNLNPASILGGELPLMGVLRQKSSPEGRLCTRNMGNILATDHVIYPNLWYHIFYSRDAQNNTRLFINGSLGGSAYFGGQINITQLGAHPPATHTFRGELDELLIWIGEDKTSCLDLLFKATDEFNVGVLDPTHWWRFGDGEEEAKGKIVYDMAGNRDWRIIERTPPPPKECCLKKIWSKIRKKFTRA